MTKYILILFFGFLTVSVANGQAQIQFDSTKISEFFSRVAYVDFCELMRKDFTRVIYKRHNPNKIIEVHHYSSLQGIITSGDSLNSNLINKCIPVQDSVILALNKIIIEESILDSRGSCYEPRNGILFYDKNYKLIGYLEVCFACRQYQRMNVPYLGHLDSKHYQQIQNLFKDLQLQTTD